MRKQQKKVKMNIKGNLQHVWTKLVLKPQIRAMGLKIHESRSYSWSHVEIVVSGESDKIWKAVSLAKYSGYFLTMDSITFEFLE